MADGTVVIDACLVITFGNAASLHVIASLKRHRVVVAKRAEGEVKKPPAVGELGREITSRAMTRNKPLQPALIRARSNDA